MFSYLVLTPQTPDAGEEYTKKGKAGERKEGRGVQEGVINTPYSSIGMPGKKRKKRRRRARVRLRSSSPVREGKGKKKGEREKKKERGIRVLHDAFRPIESKRRGGNPFASLALQQRGEKKGRGEVSTLLLSTFWQLVKRGE